MCAGRAAQAVLLSQPGAGKLCKGPCKPPPHPQIVKLFPRKLAPGHWKFFPWSSGNREREQHKACAKGKGGKWHFLAFSLSETCVYWKIFTAGKGEIAGLISTEKAGMAGRCLWIYINPKDPATTVCFASCTLGVEVVMTAAPLPLPMPPFPA